MTKPTRSEETAAALDDATLALIDANIAPGDFAADRLRKLRDNIMRRIDAEDQFDTIPADKGSWIEVAPLMEKKMLRVDADTGVESYLLRLHPGCTSPRHLHETDELCLVMDGEITFGDIHLETGDYHFAKKGSWHEDVSTSRGALLFLQTGIGASEVAAIS